MGPHPQSPHDCLKNQLISSYALIHLADICCVLSKCLLKPLSSSSQSIAMRPAAFSSIKNLKSKMQILRPHPNFTG